MKYTFVYPYKEGMAQGDELKYSLRSLCQNFKEDFEVIILGNKPKWLSDNVTCLEVELQNESPQINQAKKLTHLFDIKRLTNIIWMNDDIYFVNPVTIEDIKLNKYLIEYREGKIFNNKGRYHIAARKSLEWLRDNGKENFVYSTHLPYYFNITKLKQLFKLLPLTKVDYLLELLYFNYFCNSKDAVQTNHKGEISVRCARMLSWKEYPYLRNKINNTLFLNNAEQGFCTVLIEYLKRRFSERCKFEKHKYSLI